MVPAGVPRPAGPVRWGLPKEGGGRLRAGRGCDALLGGGQYERGRQAKPKAGDLRTGPADHAGAGRDSKIPSARCKGSALAVTSTADITIVRGVSETVRLTSSCRPERRVGARVSQEQDESQKVTVSLDGPCDRRVRAAGLRPAVQAVACADRLFVVPLEGWRYWPDSLGDLRRGAVRVGSLASRQRWRQCIGATAGGVPMFFVKPTLEISESGGVGQAGCVAGGLVGLAGAEHRQDDVAAAAGEADHGGVVAFAFGSFPVVERLGCWVARWVPCRAPCPARPARGLRMGLNQRAETVELVVSELATNAVLTSAQLMGVRYPGQWRPGRAPLRLWLWSDRARTGRSGRAGRSCGRSSAADVAPGPSRRWGGWGRTDSRAVVVPGCRGGRSGGTEPRWGSATVTEPAAAVAAGPPVGW
jgi:hypothetical protein